jgi:hypothetical protein
MTALAQSPTVDLAWFRHHLLHAILPYWRPAVSPEGLYPIPHRRRQSGNDGICRNRPGSMMNSETKIVTWVDKHLRRPTSN